MSFEVKHRAAAGRIGRFHTPHGIVTTPTLLPVVNPNLPTIPPAEMRQRFGAEMVITNSYILRKNPELRARVLRDGVHRTIGWDGPVMTDSGTFQSYVYGSVDVEPAEILDFQRQIGVDVGTILDIFTTPDTPHEQAAAELQVTLQRAAEAVRSKQGMMVAATVQGGTHSDLRAAAAQGISALDVDLVPIGGVVPLMEQGRYAELARIILASKRNLPSGRPVHLFGAGHPLVFPLAAALGCDLFDSSSYAKYAKDDRMMFPHGTRSLVDLEELACSCPECDRWRSPREIQKLPDPERKAALARHNLHVSFAEIRRIRQAIHDGSLWELVEERAAQNPHLLDAVRALRDPGTATWLETHEPTSGVRGFQYRSSHSLHRPIVHRLHERLLETWQPRSKTCVLLPERTKPYSESYAPYLDAFIESGHDFLVETPFGPVPLELDRLYPVAQSVFPSELAAESRTLRDAFTARFLHKYDGCDVIPFSPSDYAARGEFPMQGARDEFDRRRIRSIADFQFGPGAAHALFGAGMTFRRSSAGDVRNVLAGTEHVVSLRARDGLLSLRMAGALRLGAGLPSPRQRIRLDHEPASFVRDGKNIMAKFVIEADPRLRPGDDAIVVDPDDQVVAVGRCILSGWESSSFRRGLAAKNTESPATPSTETLDEDAALLVP